MTNTDDRITVRHVGRAGRRVVEHAFRCSPAELEALLAVVHVDWQAVGENRWAKAIMTPDTLTVVRDAEPGPDVLDWCPLGAAVLQAYDRHRAWAATEAGRRGVGLDPEARRVYEALGALPAAVRDAALAAWRAQQ